MTSKSTYSDRETKVWDEFEAANNIKITPEIYFKRTGMKILSGTANLATGWMELPKVIILCTQKKMHWGCDSNFASNIWEGFWKGLFFLTTRTSHGFNEFLIFWYPTPPGSSRVGLYGIDPIFIWDDFSQETIFLGRGK